jgi:outer membrane receptor protein involved in Fe transport
MEAGYKGDLEWLDSRLYSESVDSTGAFSADILLNNTFDYAEQIHALYGVVGAKRGQFGVQAGLRLEEAITAFDQQTLSESFDHSYLSLFPSVHATFEPIQGNSFKVSYSKRVRRPNTWQLNPFGDFDDPTFIRVGNPYLDPEYTHSFEAGYSRLGEAYTASITPYFRHSVDEISWHEELRDDGVTVVTFENFATEDSYGLELIGSLTLGEWLKANGSLNAYKQVTNASNVASELSSDALGYRTRLSLTATLIPGLNLQVTQFYRSPMDVPGGRIASFTMTDVALQHTVLANRATLNLRARDVFNSMGFEARRESEGYYQEFRRYPNRRELQLTFRYTFGRQQDRERQRDGNDEQPAGDEGYGGEM